MDPNMPMDPFNTDSPDLTTWAANCHALYTSLLASGFTTSEAFEFTVRLMIAMMTKSVQ